MQIGFNGEPQGPDPNPVVPVLTVDHSYIRQHIIGCIITKGGKVSYSGNNFYPSLISNGCAARLADLRLWLATGNWLASISQDWRTLQRWDCPLTYEIIPGWGIIVVEK